jgi:alcohol dehydrogenase class IV
MEAFHSVSFAQEVIFSQGALVRLPELVRQAGWRRLLLCTGSSLAADGTVTRLADGLGERLAACFDRVQPHVQDAQLEQCLDLARQFQVEAMIGLGGGSSIGMAKAVAHRLHAGQPNAPFLPIIAIPTTYAGSEMTAVFGVTHSRQEPVRKITVNDPGIAPRLALYDPELTLNLPPEITASSGINALAHCFEALYSRQANPLSTAAAIYGVRHIGSALPRCHTHPQDLKARAEMLVGAHLAGQALAGVSMGLHHGLCHVLGGTADVPHGLANAIILPHALRYLPERIAGRLLPAAEAIGIHTEGRSPVEAVAVLADEVARLAAGMDLPQNLRLAGVRQDTLPELARLAASNSTVQNDPRPASAEQIERLLEAAY